MGFRNTVPAVISQVWYFILQFVSSLEVGLTLTQVHICSLGPVGTGHILEDGIQNLLLDLSDGVTVEDLHRDLGAIGTVRIDTAQDLSGEKGSA